MAVWFALLTGLAENGLRAVKKLTRPAFVFDPALVWMSPLAEALLFLLVAALLVLLVRRRPRLVSLRNAVSTFAFLGFLSVILLVPQIHPLAGLILAAGLAVQTARTIAAHPVGFQSLVHRTVGRLCLLVVALGLGVYGWLWLGERRALAKLPPPLPGAPNVLLIVLDTVRVSNLSLYGYSRPTTPNLSRLAQTGVRFDQALSTSPWTLPSHASLFTGRFPRELSADWTTPLDDIHPTLAEVLSARGYLTGGFVANLGYCVSDFGLDRGFVHYVDHQFSPMGIVGASSLASRLIQHRRNLLHRLMPGVQLIDMEPAPRINAAFLGWLDEPRERPFFAFLNYMEAHEPYAPPPPFDTIFGPTKEARRSLLHRLGRVRQGREPKQLGTGKPSPLERWNQLQTNAYDASIAYLDQELGGLFEELRARRALDNTLVIVTSDHGQHLGEHGLVGHGNSLYMQLLHVPFVISFPGRVPMGSSVAEFVSLRDVPATVLELLGLKDAVDFPGSSLAQFWQAEDRARRPTEDALLAELTQRYTGARNDMKSLVIDSFHYIRNTDGREELYDLEADPVEERDLANSPAGREALPRFRAQLDELSRKLGRR
jgi:arylsulfatase A-like enzyme